MSDFCWAVKNGEIDQVRKAVEEEGVNVNDSFDGRTLLHFAADYGHVDMLRYLISKGANVEAKDKHGISVILAAIWEGHTSCVKLLLDKGCPKTGSAPDGTTYIDAAEKEEIKELLLPYNAD